MIRRPAVMLAMAAVLTALATSSCPFGVCGPCALDEVCVHDVDAGDRCAAPAGRGEVCRRRSDTPPDGELDHACAGGLVCLLASGSFVATSICVPADGPRLLNEPCDDAPCGAGLECMTGVAPVICLRGEGGECTSRVGRRALRPSA